MGLMTTPVELRIPDRSMLPSYVEALRRGWSARNDLPDDARRQLETIEADPDGFLAAHIDPEAKGEPITMPDGSKVPRLPGISLWIWDGEFCGVANLRWQDGTAELPEHVLGHIGYSVVPWKRGRGYATAALGLLLERARETRLEYVELTCDPGNEASRKVIEANGGVFVERFTKSHHHGGKPGLRYRIPLGAPPRPHVA